MFHAVKKFFGFDIDENKIKDLVNEDLLKNKFTYSQEQIVYSIKNNNISLRVLSRSQYLTPYICVKYVIYGGSEGKYGNCKEDKLLDIDDILLRQPHITKKQIMDMYEYVYNEEKNELKELIQMGKYDKSVILF